MLFLLLLACAGQLYETGRAVGVYHHIKRGETLYGIARAYKVNLQYLAEVNNIDKPEMIEAGNVLFIPDAKQVTDDVLISAKAARAKADIASKPVQISGNIQQGEVTSHPKSEVKGKPRSLKITPPPKNGESGNSRGMETEISLSSSLKDVEPSGVFKATENGKEEEEENTPPEEQKKIKLDKKQFVWPVEGKIVSRFGIQPNRMFINGIKISAGEGTFVTAADSGTVIFSAPLRDYGETIIIKHENDFATVYANLGQRMVKCDDHVNKGSKIAFLRKGEGKDSPVLHFEIRRKNKARNPLFFLP